MTCRNTFTHVALAASLLLASLPISGCAGLVIGAVAAGGAYEGVQASKMDNLERDYAAGKISKEEYEARKKQIDETSLFQ